MSSSARKYKVKLASGRILGPLDLQRVRLLILKAQIQGVELAREYPNGEWQDINAIPQIGDLLVKHAQELLKAEATRGKTATSAPSATLLLPGATHILPADQALPETKHSKPELDWGTQDPGAQRETKAEPKTTRLPGDANPNAHVELDKRPDKTRQEKNQGKRRKIPTPQELAQEQERQKKKKEIEDRTQVATAEELASMDPTTVAPPTNVVPFHSERAQPKSFQAQAPAAVSRSNEKTILFEGRHRANVKKAAAASGRGGIKDFLKATLAAVALGVAGYQVFFDAPPQPAVAVKLAPIRPTLPNYTQGKADPALSMKLYGEAMRAYIQDTVLGYREAATILQQAVTKDPNNVKALAMLASSYLNLIDSSNKDENYFYVISKLIELTRAKSVDLPETVIADVEFFITVNKAEAAQNRIVEYTVRHQSFGLEMFYYLGLAFYARGDAQSASKYLSNIPDNKVFSPKVFYLRGLVAEKLDDDEDALAEYGKAVAMYHQHAKSHLRMADILLRQSRIKDAAAHLNVIIEKPTLLAPGDLARAYFLDATVRESFKSWQIALGDIERAIRLDKNNPDYQLEYYSLKAKEGGSMALIRKDARMYYFLGEGEKLLRNGKYQEALDQFLQARQANDKSPLPAVKIGDMFNYLHDVNNARLNYKLATDRAPNNIEVWSKYINLLIQSYEWDDAQAAMDRFRKLPVSQSAIDKAAGDLYAKQGRQAEAQVYYKKAMSRESIDPDVYIAYAKSLMATRDYKDAPFFFALALRFDPLNIDATIGTAKCIAESDSIDRAISMLQDELQKGASARAELIAAIAELQIQKGDWDEAQRNVNQAMQANPDYAYPWKLQAEIDMNFESQRGMVDKALDAYQSYSDRNPSDPSGYLERYKIFIRRGEFDKAGDELVKIFGVYPKYPNLHYFKAALYKDMGNHKAAAEEFRIELHNNPGAVASEVGLGGELNELGDYNGALTYLSMAMQAEPRNCDAKMAAGDSNYGLKNFAGAVALYRAALGCDQGNAQIYRKLGFAYRDMGDSTSAAEAFRKYIQMEPDAPDRAELQRFL